MTDLSAQQHERAIRIFKLLNQLEQHLNRDLRLDDLAHQACYSRFHFERVFTEQIGQTPMDYLRRRRLICASKRIRFETTNLAYLAQDFGYSSNAAFSKAFRLHFGVSPRDWRHGAWRQYMDDLHQTHWQQHLSQLNAKHLCAENSTSARSSIAPQIQIRRLTPFKYAYRYWRGPMLKQQYHTAELDLALTANGAGLSTNNWVRVIREDNALLPPDLLLHEYGVCIPTETVLPVKTKLAVGHQPGGLYACLSYQQDMSLFRWLHEDWLERQHQYIFDATRPYLHFYIDPQLGVAGQLLLPIRCA